MREPRVLQIQVVFQFVNVHDAGRGNPILFQDEVLAFKCARRTSWPRLIRALVNRREIASGVSDSRRSWACSRSRRRKSWNRSRKRTCSWCGRRKAGGSGVHLRTSDMQLSGSETRPRARSASRIRRTDTRRWAFASSPLDEEMMPAPGVPSRFKAQDSFRSKHQRLLGSPGGVGEDPRGEKFPSRWPAPARLRVFRSSPDRCRCHGRCRWHC